MENNELVKSQLKNIVEKFGYTLNEENVDKIINAKLQFFGIEKWRNCPCVNDGKHACISKLCKEKIESDGVCHCNLIKKS